MFFGPVGGLPLRVCGGICSAVKRWSSFRRGRRPGEHQTAAPGAEYRRYKDVGSRGQAHCGARYEAREARLLETLVHLFNAFGSQHTNGATV